jgi:predicted nucleic acid-binding protein
MLRTDGVFVAVLDTCVLWPSLQRDFLLSLAVEGLYRPLWSSAILAELAECEALKLIDKGNPRDEAQRQAAHLVEQMQASFAGACVEGWETLEGSYGLPDPDDEHLVAAAVVGGADAIVTMNVRHLPVNKLPPGLKVISPQEFAAAATAINPAMVLRAIEAITRRRTRPSRTVDELLDRMEKTYKMTEAVTILRTLRDTWA